MKQAKIFVAGIGPGSADDVTPAATLTILLLDEDGNVFES